MGERTLCNAFHRELPKNHKTERVKKERKYRTNCTLYPPKPDPVNYGGVGGAGSAQSLKGTPGADTDIDVGRKSTQANMKWLSVALTS